MDRRPDIRLGRASDLHELGRDRNAAIAGLSLPYSSRAVEGHVNRHKTHKRQMYGRAKPGLPCKRVLPPA